MNLQMDRIRQACNTLKLNSIAVEWSAIADQSTSGETSLSNFLEQLLQVELEARAQRIRETLLKFAGLPGH